MTVILATELESPTGPRRLSQTARELQDGDTVAARIKIGQDADGRPCVEVEMLVTSTAAEAETPRRADA